MSIQFEVLAEVVHEDFTDVGPNASMVLTNSLLEEGKSSYEYFMSPCLHDPTAISARQSPVQWPSI